MANSATVKLGVEGAAQFKRDLANVTAQSKALAAEMKATATAFVNESDAEKKNAAIKETLQKQIETQQKRIDLLKKAVKDYTAAEGESGNNTLRYREQLAKAETAMHDLERQSRELENGIEDVGDEMQSSGKHIVTFGELIRANVISEAIVQGVQRLTDAVKDFATAMIGTAAEVKAETSQFEQTFGEFGDAATEAVDRVAKEAGILPTRLNGAASSIYAFARSSGGSVEQSMSLMEEALGAAADSAAYYDRSLEDTTDTLMSFLKGNFANDAALGVSATETTRNAKAMELFGKKYNDLSEIQKQQTLLKMVTDAQKLSGAMGQAAREADGWENVQGNLNETWRQFQAQVGAPFLEALIPVIKDLTTWFTSWRESIDWEEFSGKVAEFAQSILDLGAWVLENSETLISQIETIGAAIGTILVAEKVFQMVQAYKEFTAGTTLLKAAQAALNGTMLANPFVLIITLIASLVAAFVTAYKTNDEFRQKVDETWEKVKEAVSVAVESLREYYTELWETIKQTTKDIKDTIVNGVKNAITNVKNKFSEFKAAGRSLIDNMRDGIREKISTVTSAASELMQRVRDTVTGWFGNAWSWGSDLIENFKQGIRDTFPGLTSLVDSVRGTANGVSSANGGNYTNTSNSNTVNVTVNGGNDAKKTAKTVSDVIQRQIDAHLVPR